MRLILAAMIAALSGGTAMASGGVTCDFEDEKAQISINGGVTRGMGGALFSFAGEANIKDADIAKDLQATTFDRSHVAQYWLDEDGLKLKLYRERDGDLPHGFVEVTVTSPTDGETQGSYRVEIYDMTNPSEGEAEIASYSGHITCLAE
ncbi:hypothetical protein [Aquamicrobium zhengzhouense]|uniref:Uncharacterized protein n=1 Tax=Aquamicrobium zhengzhouense TaxID=2781738 RepID=A0ABS0SIT2_9HYPH|nr:hypothetical protein [Aquamicrobium zhengzhouense]MBI1622478.1 hypothetical protein [Aquamicrobium zhengzhouense]